jgi:hypothetical protein
MGMAKTFANGFSINRKSMMEKESHRFLDHPHLSERDIAINLDNTLLHRKQVMSQKKILLD